MRSKYMLIGVALEAGEVNAASLDKAVCFAPDFYIHIIS